MFAVMPAPLDVSRMRREGLVLKQVPMIDAANRQNPCFRRDGEVEGNEKPNSQSQAKSIYVPGNRSESACAVSAGLPFASNI